MPSEDWSDESSCETDLEGRLNAFVVSCLSKARPTRVSRLKALAQEAHRADHKKETASTNLGSGGAGQKRQRVGLREELLNALRQDGDHQEELLNTIVDEILTAIKSSSDRVVTAGLIRNGLADPLNTKLRRDILERRTTAGDLVDMNDLDWLNPVERERVDKERQERMSQKTVEYMERLSMTVTTIFKCPSCGCGECYANFRSTDFVKWQGDDPHPTLLRCTKCGFTFKE